MKMKEQSTDSSPVSVFEEVFSEEIVQLILKETVRYATEWKNRPSTTISSDDLKLFIGVLLISGYHKLPSETQYWSNDENLGLQVVKNAISKARFQDMKSNHYIFVTTVKSKTTRMIEVSKWENWLLLLKSHSLSLVYLKNT